MKQLLKTESVLTAGFLHWHHGASAFVGLLGIATCFPSLRLMSGNHAGVSAPHPDSGQGCALSQVAAVFQQPGSRTWVELQSMPAFSCSLHRLKCWPWQVQVESFEAAGLVGEASGFLKVKNPPRLGWCRWGHLALRSPRLPASDAVDGSAHDARKVSDGYDQRKPVLLWRRIYLDFFIFYFVFFFVLGAVARSLGARFLGFSARFCFWFPWLLGFSVSVILGHSTSYSFVVLYGLFACWFAWLLGLFGLSTCWPLDFLYASRIILYYVVLNYIKYILNYVTYIYIE